MPECNIDCLRFQFGVYTTRNQQWPVYDEDTHKVTHDQETNVPCTIFHLLGHGSTETAALDMALRALSAK